MNNYSSYLVRHWLIAEEPVSNAAEQNPRTQVFDIEHVQSGRRTRVRQLEEANTWINSISNEAMKNSDSTYEMDQALNSLPLEEPAG
jgi:hypothetical protein